MTTYAEKCGQAEFAMRERDANFERNKQIRRERIWFKRNVEGRKDYDEPETEY